eukprot:TRINITY_DN9405_c0_g1_i4.p5 TRINITY_DN9405_c0_g1~~TRINITY_DN9405_c0_g1_i4.p5  ORF type:complete len:113 (-),score=5.21 TRINITY_DN9405_c0_g1_i4:1348-1686(-)
MNLVVRSYQRSSSSSSAASMGAAVSPLPCAGAAAADGIPCVPSSNRNCCWYSFKKATERSCNNALVTHSLPVAQQEHDDIFGSTVLPDLGTGRILCSGLPSLPQCPDIKQEP